jgi:serine/threonine protein kinase
MPRLEDDINLAQTVRGLRPGQRVFDRYTLNRVLGRGAMGVVWQAKDEKLGHDVALKFLPEVLTLNPGAKDELKEETKRALKLTHNHIVRIYDFVEQSDCAAIAMEYVDGDTLASLRLHRQDKVFSVKEAGPWVEELCDALGYAHFKAKVVHRDLKPANLMVDARNELKIMDFGIARSLSDTMTRLTRPGGEVSGTLAYMSPQQMMGAEPTAQDDIYALGATIYELLTGKPPFYSGDIASQAQTKVPPTMTERRKQLQIAGGGPIPKEWEDVVAACLAKKPAQRPQTAAEVAHRLGLRAEAPVQPTQVLPKPAGGKKPLILAAVVVLLVASVLAAWQFKKGKHVPLPGTECALQVITEPAEASVTLNDDTKTSPARFVNLAQGTYRLRVTKPGFDTVLQEIAVVSSNQTVDPIKLTRSTGTLAIESDLSNVVFSLTDPTDQLPPVNGTAPTNLARLPVGKYTLKASAGGLAAPEQPVEIEPNVQRTVKLSFPIGFVRIETEPPGASIVQGNLVMGQTPMVLQAPTGELAYTLMLNGYQPTPLAAMAQSGVTNTYNLKLVPVKAEALCDVRVETEPSEASVSLNGETKASPAQFRQLKPGTYDLKVSKAGFEPFTQNAIITNSGTLGPIALRQSTGSLAIRSDPPGASFEVTADSGRGQPMSGTATANAAFTNLLIGKYRLKARLGSFDLPERTVEVTRNAEQVVNLVFPLGYVRLASKPVSADVFDGSVRLGKTPTLLLLPTTSRDYTFRADTYEPKVTAIGAKSGVTSLVEVTLSPIPPPPSRDPVFTNSLGMVFKSVPGAKAHFCVHETRVMDFAVFIRETPQQKTYRPPFDQKSDHPVVGVTWQSATNFCRWLTEKERKEKLISPREIYRLPTDAEWSAAVGLQDETGASPEERARKVAQVFPWGQQWPPPPNAGNFGGSEATTMKDGPPIPIQGYQDAYPRTAPVMRNSANVNGLFDLSGNVWEWVEDRYDVAGNERVLRGGSWVNYQPHNLYSGARLKEAPDNPKDYYGFRVVLAPVSP